MAAWTNWAGTVTCTPARIARPDSEDALREVVGGAAGARRPVRVAGNGHSFMPLCATPGTLISLERFAGIEALDDGAREATVRAGTRLHDLGEPLLEAGLAMENLGDIDVQTLGGALGTGTHGTGRALGNLATQLASLRLVLASGDVVECSAEREPDLFRAARVSVGALGVIAAARLRLLPAYRLHERIWREDVAICLEALEERIASHRHFEFFWYPGKDVVEAKTLSATDADPDPLPDAKGERIDWSARVIPSVREQKFHEMEYSVPAADGPACFRAVRERILHRFPDVQWPVEYRTLRADDAWLSTASGRDTVTISVHQDARLPFREFFADVETIFREVGGRPHWGKIHTCRARELAELYPRFADFQALRRRLDPDGVFLNDHLREILV